MAHMRMSHCGGWGEAGVLDFEGGSESSMDGLGNFDEIRRVVMEDQDLMAELTPLATETELFARVIELGRERGIAVTVDELVEIVRANRREWLERWLV